MSTRQKIIIIIVIIWIAMIAISTYQNNPQTILSNVDTARLESQAKQLICKVYFLGIFPAGKAVLRDEGLTKLEGSNFYHLSAQAGVESFLSKIYPFSANIDSYLSPETFLPIVFRQNIQAKDKELKKEVRYNQTNNVMEISGEKRTIFPETYEPLSALYKLRRMDLDKMPNFDLNINTNQKNYAFTGDISKENIQTKSGSVGIYRLKGQIFRRDKNPYHQSKIEIVLLDNGPKTPIFIKVFASGVLITVRLIGQMN